MADSIIGVGEHYKINDKLYTVIGFRGNTIVFIETDSSRTNMIVLSLEKFISMFNEKSIKRIITKSDSCVIIEMLTDFQRENYLKNLAFVRDVEEKFSSDFMLLKTSEGSRIFGEIREKHNFTVRKAWRVIRKYLQSGFDTCSLVPKQGTKSKKGIVYSHKTGRRSNKGITPGIIVDDKVRNHFEHAKNNFMKNRPASIKGVYDEMITINYSFKDKTGKNEVLIPLPKNLAPTYKQLYYYIKNNTDKDELEKAKTSKREYRNNSRLRLSDNLNKVNGPCSIVEVDECELDVFLVSRDNPNREIGRPIVYIAIDIFTRLVIGVSVSLENNSINGICNCLLNLIDDKKALCEKYGLDLPTGAWPDHYLPTRIRCDYGSEYISNEIDRICSEVNIQRELVSPGTGSLKGQVEQFFHQVQNELRYPLYNNGLIEKRHDSTHKTNAYLNIDDITKIVISAIIKHNCSYMESYPLTSDMRNKGVMSIPHELWQYGIEINGAPKMIINEDAYRYTLLRKIKAKITNEGVIYEELKYIQENDEYLLSCMIKAGKKAIPFDCRIDTRCVNNIYYQLKGQAKILHLNCEKTGMADYVNLSLTEVEEMRARKKMMNEQGKELNQKITINHKNIQNEVVKAAKKNAVIPTSENLRENRKAEKKKVAQDELIMKEVLQKEKDEPEKNVQPKLDEGEEVNVTIEEALASLKALDDERYG